MAELTIHEQVKRWRAHPNYHRTCACGHRSVLHIDGEGECHGMVDPDQCHCTSPEECTCQRCDCKAFVIAGTNG